MTAEQASERHCIAPVHPHLDEGVVEQLFGDGSLAGRRTGRGHDGHGAR